MTSNIVTIETNKGELKSIEEAMGTSYTGRNPGEIDY